MAPGQPKINAAQYLFPFDIIEVALQKWKADGMKIFSLGEENKPKERAELAERVLQEAKTTAEQLRRKGIPLKIICPKKARDAIWETCKLVRKELGNHQLADDVETILLGPIPEQLAVLHRMQEPLNRLSNAIDNGNQEQFAAPLSELEHCNTQLSKINEEVGLKAKDHTVDVAGINGALVRGGGENDPARRRELFQSTNQGMRIWTIQCKHPVAPAGQRISPTEGEPVVQELLDSTEDGNEGALTTTGGNTDLSKPKGKIPRLSDFANSSEYALSGYNPLNEPQSRETSVGRIEWVRPVGHGHRFCLNRGTDINPLYFLSTGTKLGFSKYMPEPDYVLPRAKKDRKRTDFVEALARASMTFGENKSREMHYFLVLWKGSGAGAPNEKEWLTTAELSKYMPKSKIERLLEYTHFKIEDMTNLLDNAKRQGLHPDTGQPLTDAQKEDRPWLAN